MPANFTLIYIDLLPYSDYLNGKGNQIHKKVQLISLYPALKDMVKGDAFKASLLLQR